MTASRNGTTRHKMGRTVLGPILLEFCVRLHERAGMLPAGGDAALLFCARGGLRLQHAYERYLEASGQSSPVLVAPIMVSRLVAMRAALATWVRNGPTELCLSAADALARDFSARTTRDTLRALMPADTALPADLPDGPVSAARLCAALRAPAGAAMVRALEQQTALFREHLDVARAGRTHVVLVDTGRFGTTARLLKDAFPDLTFSSLLMVRLMRLHEDSPGVHRGLLVEAHHYSALRPRTSSLRHWMLFEDLLEPELATVTAFRRVGDDVVSDLQVPGWQEQVPPRPGSMSAAAMDYVASCAGRSRADIAVDERRAWRSMLRAIVLPDAHDAQLLRVAARSYDFGTDAWWGPRPWAGTLRALRGPTLWREGEIAGTGSWSRIPVLCAVEVAYNVRAVVRWALVRSLSVVRCARAGF